VIDSTVFKVIYRIDEESEDDEEEQGNLYLY